MNIVIGIFKETFFLFIEMAKFLMLGLTFVGILHIFFKKDMIAKHIGKNSLWSIIKASILGVPLPLCSCGVVPTSVFFAKNGASKAAVVSFLISTPQTGLDSIAATYGMMGGIFAIFRPLAAFIMGIVGGIITKFFDADSLSNKDSIFYDKSSKECTTETCSTNLNIQKNTSAEKISKLKIILEKIRNMFKYAYIEFLDDIALHFIAGILIAGIISYFIPDNFFSNGSFNSGILGMLGVILIGIPMYICATSSIPIAVSLMLKGFSPGIAFVFLAVGPATNAATIAVLSKVLGKKVLTIYLVSISILSILFGYLLDFIYTITKIDPISNLKAMNHQMNNFSYFDYAIAAFFLGLLLLSLIRKYFRKEKKMGNKNITIQVNGMTCNHCSANVERAAKSVEGVTNAVVSLENKLVSLEGNFDIEAVKKAIIEMGYEAM